MEDLQMIVNELDHLVEEEKRLAVKMRRKLGARGKEAAGECEELATEAAAIAENLRTPAEAAAAAPL